MSKTKLAFVATVKGVKVNQPKDEWRGSVRVEASSIDLTLRVESPGLPQPPRMPYNLEHAQRDLKKFKKPPAEGDKKRAEYDKLVAEVEQGGARHAEALRKHAAHLEQAKGQLLQYAQLVGVASIFGSRKLHITVTPANQDLLPGIGVELLELPAPEDDDDDDDLFDDEDDEE